MYSTCIKKADLVDIACCVYHASAIEHHSSSVIGSPDHCHMAEKTITSGGRGSVLFPLHALIHVPD